MAANSPNLIHRTWPWLGALVLYAALAGCVAPPMLHGMSPIQISAMQSAVVPQTISETPAPFCRMGLNVSSFPNKPFYINDFDIAPLRAGWYVDYRAAPSPAANNGAEYVMVMGVSDNEAGEYSYSPTGTALDETIAAHPGGIYILGNEPDRRKLQSDVLPEGYAYSFHDAYAEIKSKDPTARVWAGAIVQPTPVRLQYLDLVLKAYEARYGEALPADGWAIHSFILNERSCDAYNHDLNVCWGAEIPPGIDATDGEIRTPNDNARFDLFAAGVVRFRTWMATNGYRNTPLFVSEYGVLMPPVFGFPPDRVNDYMTTTFDYMQNTKDEKLGLPADDNRLVQRFAWFSTFDPDFNGYLYESTNSEQPMTPPFVLSVMGAHYRDYAAQQAETSDLAVVTLATAESPLRIVATIGNGGNRVAPTQAVVRFYQGTTLETAVQVGEDVAVTLAGCGAKAVAAIEWDGVEEGNPATYRVWAQVIQPDFADANPENDIASQDVVVNGLPLFLPALQRAVP